MDEDWDKIADDPSEWKLDESELDKHYPATYEVSIHFDADTLREAQSIHDAIIEATSQAICGVGNEEDHDCTGAWVASMRMLSDE